MGFIAVIGMLVFGVVQIYAGFLGIDFYFGAFWAWAAIVVMFMTRISLPLTVGAFFGALHVWHWPWYGALAFAAPGVVLGIVLMVPSLFEAARERVRG